MKSLSSTSLGNQAYPRVDGVVFRSKGSLLRGILFQADGEGPHPTLLLLHGIPGIEQNVDIARALCQKGWNALIFHYRGCWGSEGRYSILGILEDTKVAVQFLKELDTVDRNRMAIAGLSLGGWASLAYASNDCAFQCIVSMAPLADPRTTPLSRTEAEKFAVMLSGTSAIKLQDEWKKIPPLTSFAPKLHGRRILLITAGRDEYFTPTYYHDFLVAAPWVESLNFPRADHVFFNCRRKLLQTVVSWLNNCCGW